jgi:hypothetical protein
MTGKPVPSDEAAEAAALAVSVAASATPVASVKDPKRAKRVELLTPDEELSMAALKRRDRGQTIKLRWGLALFAIIAVSVQILVANLIFGWYMWANGWRNLPSEIMIAWMSATVVEVIGIVVIIARNLFPSSQRAMTRRDLAKLVKSLRS